MCVGSRASMEPQAASYGESASEGWSGRWRLGDGGLAVQRGEGWGEEACAADWVTGYTLQRGSALDHQVLLSLVMSVSGEEDRER